MPLILDRGGRRQPLHCHRCKKSYADNYTDADARKFAARGLRIERGGQRRRMDWRVRTVVNVTCPNGHEWWSRHPEAIARSRKRDKRARAKGAPR
jgi:hypothetical protein